MADNESTAIHPDVAPAENEVVIVKRRVELSRLLNLR